MTARSWYEFTLTFLNVYRRYFIGKKKKKKNEIGQPIAVGVTPILVNTIISGVRWNIVVRTNKYINTVRTCGQGPLDVDQRHFVGNSHESAQRHRVGEGVWESVGAVMWSAPETFGNVIRDGQTGMTKRVAEKMRPGAAAGVWRTTTTGRLNFAFYQCYQRTDW